MLGVDSTSQFLPSLVSESCQQLATCRRTGSAWASLHVNGAASAVQWSSVLEEQWVHLHMETLPSSPLDLGLTLMASAEATGSQFAGNLKGLLSEVYLWSRPLLEYEFAVIAMGFQYNDRHLTGLSAYFGFEVSARSPGRLLAAADQHLGLVDRDVHGSALCPA